MKYELKFDNRYFFIKTSSKRSKEVVVFPVSYTETNIYDWDEIDCKCHYSNKIFKAKDGIVLGAVIPQTKNSYLCHPEANSDRLYSVKLFNEFERNCNTCKHLKRISSGNILFHGDCDQSKINHPYIQEDNTFKFHPDDYMGMECYEPR